MDQNELDVGMGTPAMHVCPPIVFIDKVNLAHTLPPSLSHRAWMYLVKAKYTWSRNTLRLQWSSKHFAYIYSAFQIM